MRRLSIMLGAVTVPFLLFLIWLFPSADSSASTVSKAGEHFVTLVNRNGGQVSMKSEWLTRGGPIVIAGLACIPLAAAATTDPRRGVHRGRRPHVVILVLIVPWFFTPFADVMSISQGRRFAFYLPFAFALTGGALVLARFRWFAVAGALLLGGVAPPSLAGRLQATCSRIPGPAGSPGSPPRVRSSSSALALRQTLNLRYGDSWALAIVIAFVLPAAVVGHPRHEDSTGPSRTGSTTTSSPP